MESITTALTTQFTSVGTALTGIVGDILPIALPIIGGVMVVKIGIKIFKSITGKA